jgi:hypothetical protein
MATGMQIDESDEQFRNTQFSIRESLESESNVTVQRDSHPSKQRPPSLATDGGMQSCESDAQF